jgi:hypothetical protein
MKVIVKDFLSFYKVAHFNYGVLITPFTIGLGMIPGNYMSAFFVFIILSMIALSHHYDKLLNAKMYIRIEILLTLSYMIGFIYFIATGGIMVYIVAMKLFDIFKEYLIRAESTIFHQSMDIIVKKDYTRFYILGGLFVSTIIFWWFPQKEAIIYSLYYIMIGDSIAFYYKIKMFKSINKV